MKNKEIIRKVALEKYGETWVKENEDENGNLPLHTLAGWERNLGPCEVKPNATGISTKIWKSNKKGNPALVSCTLYDESQIERRE